MEDKCSACGNPITADVRLTDRFGVNVGVCRPCVIHRVTTSWEKIGADRLLGEMTEITRAIVKELLDR